jgi:hypothetical protein
VHKLLYRNGRAVSIRRIAESVGVSRCCSAANKSIEATEAIKVIEVIEAIDVLTPLCYNAAITNPFQEQDPMPRTARATISYTYFYYPPRAHRLPLSDLG